MKGRTLSSQNKMKVGGVARMQTGGKTVSRVPPSKSIPPTRTTRPVPEVPRTPPTPPVSGRPRVPPPPPVSRVPRVPTTKPVPPKGGISRLITPTPSVAPPVQALKRGGKSYGKYKKY